MEYFLGLKMRLKLWNYWHTWISRGGPTDSVVADQLSDWISYSLPKDLWNTAMPKRVELVNLNYGIIWPFLVHPKSKTIFELHVLWYVCTGMVWYGMVCKVRFGQQMDFAGDVLSKCFQCQNRFQDRIQNFLYYIIWTCEALQGGGVTMWWACHQRVHQI